MRSPTIATTLLSLTFTGHAALAEERVVLDTVTGAEDDTIDQFCDTPHAYVESYCSTGCRDYNVPDGGLAVRVHADATMTVNKIANRFTPIKDPGGDPVDDFDGWGMFAIADASSQQTIWTSAAMWRFTGTYTASASVDGVTLHRGHDYLITYAASFFRDPGPDADPLLCSNYASVTQTSNMGLVPVGYGRVHFAPTPSSALNIPVWTLDSTALSTSRIPSFTVWATVGDTDADGILDDVDNCMDVANESQTDFDLDGVGDACDNCKSIYNPDQDACSGGGGSNPDHDGDGVFDVRDNCPFEANAGQADSDHDGTGDACDGSDEDTGCNALGASPSLLVALAALLIRRRRR